MRLLPLFSKPRNDEFYGILEFLIRIPKKKPPNPQKNKGILEFLGQKTAKNLEFLRQILEFLRQNQAKKG